jgi:biofilm protein TabA
MRKVARVRDEAADARWVILYDCSEGVYVFPCATDEDGSACGDLRFETVEDAEQHCEDEYGIRAGDWIALLDPPLGCQQDWITPVRVPGRETGEPRWGELERFVEGAWIALWPADPRPTIEEAISALR